jgi:hypothetical protein
LKRARKTSGARLLVLPLATGLTLVFATVHGFAFASASRPWPEASSIRWPEGTETLPFDNSEGVILLRATARRAPVGTEQVGGAGSDTTGWFVFDTGAGFLALDSRFAVTLGILDSIAPRSIAVAQRPLPRLTIGGLAIDQLAPVLLFRSSLLGRVTEREIMGLIGYRVVRDRAVWVDYGARRLALVPASTDQEMVDAEAIAGSRRLLQAGLSSGAIPCRFRMTEDGKVLLRVRVTPMSGGRATPWLTLVLDTGASKTTLFEDVLQPLTDTRKWRPVMKGLIAPTLVATTTARLCRARRVEVRGSSGTAQAEGVDVALVSNPMARDLEQLAGEPVHGLIGYSFLQRFRVACDYPRRVLWLDPTPGIGADRSPTPAHVGVQIERDGEAVRVVAVVEDSPAARAGIVAGDEVISVDGRPVAGLGSVAVARSMEGRPGTLVTLTLRRGELEQTYRLRRRRFL